MALHTSYKVSRCGHYMNVDRVECFFITSGFAYFLRNGSVWSLYKHGPGRVYFVTSLHTSYKVGYGLVAILYYYYINSVCLLGSDLNLQLRVRCAVARQK